MASNLISPYVMEKNSNMATQTIKLIREPSNYGRCHICDRNRDRKTTIKCDVCSLSCCKGHSKYICVTCLDRLIIICGSVMLFFEYTACFILK